MSNPSFKERWASSKTDGCTDVPDLWLGDACDRHDRHYATHMHKDGTPITRAEADWEFLKDGRRDSPTFITRNTVPFIYWIGVRLFGGTHW